MKRLFRTKTPKKVMASQKIQMLIIQSINRKSKYTFSLLEKLKSKSNSREKKKSKPRFRRRSNNCSKK